jgi:hypothetical protein
MPFDRVNAAYQLIGRDGDLFAADDMRAALADSGPGPRATPSCQGSGGRRRIPISLLFPPSRRERAPPSEGVTAHAR